jgi:hypothetical protein
MKIPEDNIDILNDLEIGFFEDRIEENKFN